MCVWYITAAAGGVAFKTMLQLPCWTLVVPENVSRETPAVWMCSTVGWWTDQLTDPYVEPVGTAVTVGSKCVCVCVCVCIPLFMLEQQTWIDFNHRFFLKWQSLRTLRTNEWRFWKWIHTPDALVPSSQIAWHLVYEKSYAILTSAQTVRARRWRNNQKSTFFTPLYPNDLVFPPFMLPFSAAAPSSCWGRSLPWTIRSASRWSCVWVPESPRCRRCASKPPGGTKQTETDALWLQTAFSPAPSDDHAHLPFPEWRFWVP